MKAKVLAQLKTRFASRGFSKETLEGLAEIAVKNLTDESTEDDIKNAVSGLDGIAEIMQKESNRMVTAAVKKFDGFISPDDPRVKKDEVQNDKDDKQKPQGMTNEEIAALIKSGIEEGLKPYKEREERTRLSGLLSAHDKVKNIPAAFRSRYTLDDETKLEELASQMENDYAALKQEIVKSGEFVAPPTRGNGGNVESDDDLIEFMQNMGENQ